jgi:transposase-like protein
MNGLPWLLPRECPEPDEPTLRQRPAPRVWDVRDVIPDTNAIESVNARFRRAVRRRGHFPNEQAALKVLYLTIREKIPNKTNAVGKTNGWKSILNTLTIHYGDRLAIN